MEVQVQALCDSYSRQLGGTLGMLARGLQASLEGAQEAEGRKIGELAEQVDRHDQLKDRAKKLRYGGGEVWCVLCDSEYLLTGMQSTCYSRTSRTSVTHTSPLTCSMPCIVPVP